MSSQRNQSHQFKMVHAALFQHGPAGGFDLPPCSIRQHHAQLLNLPSHCVRDTGTFGRPCCSYRRWRSGQESAIASFGCLLLSARSLGRGGGRRGGRDGEVESMPGTAKGGRGGRGNRCCLLTRRHPGSVVSFSQLLGMLGQNQPTGTLTPP